MRWKFHSNSDSAIVAAAALAFVLSPPNGASAYTLKTLHAFCSLTNCVDGANPLGGLLMDKNGNLFGTTTEEGAFGYGTVFRLAPTKTGTWKYTVLYSFCGQTNCLDGAQPWSDLIIDTAGNLYGTTEEGGAGQNLGQGTVFELVRNGGNWIETVLYNFCPASGCKDGQQPRVALTYAGQASGKPFDGSSPLFGSTLAGGQYHRGVAYNLTRNGTTWSEQVIHSFSPASGPGPLLMDGTGNLYGTTYGGGPNGYGRLYELAQSTWHQTILYDFCSLGSCADGANPLGRLVQDGSGDMYGVTNIGGTANDGVAFKLVPNGTSSQYTVLYNFCAQVNCTDGRVPTAGLIVDSSNAFFGTTEAGGSHDAGTVFKLGHTGQETVLYNFCSKTGCKDGRQPHAPVIMDKNGNLFGTTVFDVNDAGTVFELTP